MFGNCPRCGTELSTEQVYGSSIICDCGWSRPLRTTFSDRSHLDATSSLLILFGGLLVAAFIHAVNWDSHFLTIIPLKIKHYAGIAQVQDYERMALICLDRKKVECAETSYNRIAFLQPKNLDNLERLAKIQFQRHQLAGATATLTQYFTLKGNNIEAAYIFAQILQKQKRYDESERYYKFALSKRSNKMQISITRAYVQMLMEANKLVQAKNVLLHYRSKSSTASLFMNKELKEIRIRLGEIRRTAAY